MFQFGLTNFRRLKEVPAIPIRPITLLVGRNSSGKSSFLRALPLLRQSLMTRTSSPILWYGGLVDFGSFDGVVYNNDTTNPITFHFGLDGAQARISEFFSDDLHFYPTTTRMFTNIKTSISLSTDHARTQDSSRTFITKISLTLPDIETDFSLFIEKSGLVTDITLNNISVMDLYSDFDIRIQNGSIFPDFLLYRRKTDEKGSRFYPRNANLLTRRTADAIRPHLDQRVKPDTAQLLAFKLLSLPTFDAQSLKSLSSTTDIRSFSKLLSNVCGADNKRLRAPLETLYLANLLIPALRATFLHLSAFTSQVLYIGPARVHSERYYRYQELAVSEIDPDGKNFPMFLNSLNPKHLDSFSKWVEARFGYGVQIERSKGHISISLTDGGANRNIVDTGYGISQILPVLGQIWWASFRESSVRPELRAARRSDIPDTLLLIEQPELHLHPAHQSLLADALVGENIYKAESGKKEKTISFMVETHSEALINRFGELVSGGRLSPDEIQILIFDPDSVNLSATDVTIARFNESGALMNWPYGFFQPA
jgi:hypothetical protein